jgi:GTPase involved in cell partitioning and DNA repair
MQLRGLAGTDVTINAPLGVTVLTDEGEILGDLTTNNQTITVAQGRYAVTGDTYFLFTNDPLWRPRDK